MVATTAKKVQAHVEQRQLKIAANKDRAGRAAAVLLKRVMREQAPYRTHARGLSSRHLRASIRIRRVAEGWRVKPESRVAHLVIGGVKAHDLSRRSKRAMAFSEGGETVFASRAHSPGFSANPFVARTREIATGEAKAVAGEVLFHDAPDPAEENG